MAKQLIPEEQHNIEIYRNLESWHKKPLLKAIYLEFYKLIGCYINHNVEGKIVELGSGIGNLKMVVPNVICTDIFKNPWIDQVENAYQLSFENESVSNIILFDVFHHLKYLGTALNEFKRVLKKNGRVIIFEPSMSLLGLIVFGLFHHEPIAIRKKINWFSENDFELNKDEYYAAQGNASRIFGSKKYQDKLSDWEIIKIKKLPAISYVLSGGYGKRQLYPDKLLPAIKVVDKIFNIFPMLFATRLLVVLEKK
jgi:SAM-dependent methyltransferase